IDLGFWESHGKNAVHETVAIENIGIARRDYNSKAIIGDSPRGMCAARTATESRAREQNGCAFILRPVQDEIRIGLFTREVAPIIEQDSAISLLGLELQELFRHHLIGVDVYAVKGKNQSSVS